MQLFKAYFKDLQTLFNKKHTHHTPPPAAPPRRALFDTHTANRSK